MILLAHTRGFGMVAMQGQPLVPFKITSIEIELTEAERLRSTQLVMAILLRLVTNMDDSEKQVMRSRITEFLSSSKGHRTVALLNFARRKSKYYEAARDARGELPSLIMVETVGSAGPNEGAVQQN